LVNFDADTDDVASRLSELVPTVRRCQAPELSWIRQAEYDAVVFKDGFSGEVAPHLQALVWGGHNLGDIHSQAGFWTARFSMRSAASEFIVPDDSDAEARRLVVGGLLPKALAAGENAVFGANSLGGMTPTLSPSCLRVFLADPDNKVLAGSFMRRGMEAECWFIPASANIVEWFRYALTKWHERDADRFPRVDDWHRRPEWQSPEEAALTRNLATAEAELAIYVAKAEAVQDDLRARLSQAEAEATDGMRRLLTSQGAALVSVVTECLAALGFQVVDVDASAIDAASAKREDLRVTIAGVEWESLVEVRGYTKGTQLNDLLRLGRFVARFAAECGRQPAATWYVVNQFLNEDPDARQLPLAGHDEEVQEFASSSGAVIDTRELFKLWRAVLHGDIEVADAQRQLRGAVGRFAAVIN
jgi:hypothetical protein